MKVGVLDILAWPADRASDHVYNYVMTKQYASITPQAISVWCRRLGHEVHYATYYGFGDPGRALPADLDVVFVSCYSRVSALAYAVGKLYRQRGALTVIGGPHAKAFPLDCLRFFDIVVKECNDETIRTILARDHAPGSVVSTNKPFDDVPSVQERMPEIRKSAFAWGRRPYLTTWVPMLTSTGCPYDCSFCIDWANPYRLLPLDRLAEDLRYLATHQPNVFMAFYDPNFAVKFDQVIDTLLDTLPPGRRLPYLMEMSLTILKGDRVAKLGASNCKMVAPGVESWTDFSKKAGAGQKTGTEKLDLVVSQFEALNEEVPYLQANFMFGLDDDAGDEPIELTKQFMWRAPYVWSVINIPHPFGGTPLQEQYLAEGRVLKELPLSFYYMPYAASTMLNYDTVTYYDKLIELVEYAVSKEMLRHRLRQSRDWRARLIHRVRTSGMRGDIPRLRAIRDRLAHDRGFRAFHEGRDVPLPEYYHHEFERQLGRYASLISRDERRPVFGDYSAPESVMRPIPLRRADRLA